MMMFDDKVGGWGWLYADVIKKYTRKKLCVGRKKGWNFLKKPFFYAMPIISIKTDLKSIHPFEDITDQFNSSD